MTALTVQRVPLSGGVLRLVSHNVFWLQGAPFVGDRPGPFDPVVLEGLAGVYRELAPDVLCLQEIQSAETAAALGEALGLPHRYSAGGRHAQYGGMVLSRFPLESLPLRETVDRVIQRFRVAGPGGATLVFANVHLPSNKHRGREGGAAERAAELPLVVGADGESTGVALGDFNEPPDGPCARTLASWGYVDAAAHDGQGDRPSSIKGSRGDHVWLAPDVVASLVRYLAVEAERLAFTHPADATKTHLSDHLPIGVEIA
jgi:endonuclease/exonuclease/phosphatase family metal-dependent hydrolase